MEHRTVSGETDRSDARMTNPYEMVEKLKSAQFPDFLQVECGEGSCIGTYTIVDGTLQYQAGPKNLKGKRAWKYLITDCGASGCNIRLTEKTAAGHFSQTDQANKNQTRSISVPPKAE